MSISIIAQPIPQSPPLPAHRSVTHVQHIVIWLISGEELTYFPSQIIYYDCPTHSHCSNWIDSHIRAFEFFGGVPTSVVLDNLKAGVIKTDIYYPTLNRAYGELERHYGFVAGGFWGRIFILDFAYILRTFPSDTKMKEQPATRVKPSKFN